MPYKFNPFSGILDYYKNVRSGANDPSGGSNFDWFFNTTSNTLKIYYDGSWQTLHTLVSASAYLMETGDNILLETGDKILMEA